MSQNEDNKNYGSVFIVSLITLLISAGFIYLLVNIFIVCLSIKLRYESIENLPQNRYALISSTNIIVAVVLGKVFFGERITPNQMVGALVIIFGIMYILSYLIYSLMFF